MTFLDTHVVLWLYVEADRIPEPVQVELDENKLFISLMVRLEMAFLHEIGRLADDPNGVLHVLERDLGLSVENDGWLRASEIGCHLTWTRDPFDRVITSHAFWK